MSTPTKITKKSGGLGRLKTRAAAKATGAPVVVEEPAAVNPAEAPVAPPVGQETIAESTKKAPSVPKKAPAAGQPAEGKIKDRKASGGEGQDEAPKKRSSYIYVQDAYEAQRQILEETKAGRLALIDFTDADGGYKSRIRTSIHLAPEALEAINELEIDEAVRFGKAPKLYHYIELALTRFMPTAKDAGKAKNTDISFYESISTAVNREAKLAMRKTRRARNADGEIVAKHWFYTEAVLRMVEARRKALGL